MSLHKAGLFFLVLLLSTAAFGQEKKLSQGELDATKEAIELTRVFASHDSQKLGTAVPQAMPKLVRGGKEYPRNDMIQFALFVGYTYAEQKEKALEAIDKAYRLMPDNPMYGMNYALMLKINGEGERARTLMEAVSKAKHDPPQFRSVLAALDMATQHYDLAEQNLLASLTAVPQEDNGDRGVLLSELGDATLHQGQYAKAADYLMKSIIAFPDNGLAHSRYGETLLKSGKSKEALKELEIAIAQNPLLPDPLYYKAIALQTMGDSDGSHNYFQKAYAVAVSAADHSDSGRSFFLLGQIEKKLGKNDDAKKHLAEAKRRGYSYEAPFANKNHP